MDEDRFVEMINSPNMTRKELIQVRANAIQNNHLNRAKMTEAVLDRRFPSWNKVGKAKPRTISGSQSTPSAESARGQDAKVKEKSRPQQSDLVAILAPASLLDKTYASQVLLLFDRIALDLFDTKLPKRNIPTLLKRADLLNLRHEGLLTTVSELVVAQTGRLSRSVEVHGGDILGNALGRGFQSTLSQVAARDHQAKYGLRYSAATLRNAYGLDAVIVAPQPSFADLEQSSARDANRQRDMVFHITLNEFPAPAPETPWEAIREFKNEGRRHMSLLREWINRTVTENYDERRATDEIRELQYKYEEAMKIERLKFQRGTLESIVVTAAEFAESFARFEFSKAVEAVFKLRKTELSLLEAEMKAPGREVAYIVGARERFEL